MPFEHQASVVPGGGGGGGESGTTHIVSLSVSHIGALISTRPEQHWSRPPGAEPQPPPPHWPQARAQQAWPLRMPSAHQPWNGAGGVGGCASTGGDDQEGGGGEGGGSDGGSVDGGEGSSGSANGSVGAPAPCANLRTRLGIPCVQRHYSRSPPRAGLRDARLLFPTLDLLGSRAFAADLRTDGSIRRGSVGPRSTRY